MEDGRIMVDGEIAWKEVNKLRLERRYFRFSPGRDISLPFLHRSENYEVQKVDNL